MLRWGFDYPYLLQQKNNCLTAENDNMFHLLDGRDELYQWDLNVKVVVEADDINEVHFANKTCSRALVAEVHSENNYKYSYIPNVLLQQPYDLKVYGYTPSHTEYDCVIPVVLRPKPENYIYTENEKYTVQEIVNDALQQAKDSGDFKGDPGERGEKGEKGDTPVKGIDYYTEEEKKAFAKEIIKEINLSDKISFPDTVLGKYAVTVDNGVVIARGLSAFVSHDTEANNIKDRIAQYPADGCLYSNIPTKNYQTANKKYVDDTIQKYYEEHPVKDGVSPTITTENITDGHRITITDIKGTKSIDLFNGEKGEQGIQGEKGEKGEKGDPYALTEEDKAIIVLDVLNALPDGDEVAY